MQNVAACHTARNVPFVLVQMIDFLLVTMQSARDAIAWWEHVD